MSIVIHAVLVQVAIGAALGGGKPIQADRIIYETEATGAPLSNRVYVFDPRRSLMTTSDSPLTETGRAPGSVWVKYKISTVGNIRTSDFGGFSLPMNFHGQQSWTSGGVSCQSRQFTENDNSKYLVTCNKKNAESFSQRAIVYVATKEKGVIGFFGRCFSDFTCWFNLKSEDGLLK